MEKWYQSVTCPFFLKHFLSKGDLHDDELAKFCVPVGRLVLPGLKIEIFLIVMHIAIFVRCNMGENFYLRTGLVCVLSLYQKGSHALVCHLITILGNTM